MPPTLGPKLGPGPFGPNIFLDFLGCAGGLLDQCGTFYEILDWTSSQLTMEGVTPCKKHAGDLQEPTKTLKKLSPGTKNQNPRENFAQNRFFFCQFLVLQHHNLEEQP